MMMVFQSNITSLVSLIWLDDLQSTQSILLCTLQNIIQTMMSEHRKHDRRNAEASTVIEVLDSDYLILVWVIQRCLGVQSSSMADLMEGPYRPENVGPSQGKRIHIHSSEKTRLCMAYSSGHDTIYVSTLEQTHKLYNRAAGSPDSLQQQQEGSMTSLKRRLPCHTLPVPSIIAP